MPDQLYETDAPQQRAAENQPTTDFAVTDEKTANWVIRRILAARAYRERVKTWAQAEQRRADREEALFFGRYGDQLDIWLRAELARRGGKAKSINLPAGRLGLRSSKPKLLISNSAAALDWARAHCPAAIRQTESLIKTPLNQHLHNTGELPTGTQLEPERDELYVR